MQYAGKRDQVDASLLCISLRGNMEAPYFDILVSRQPSLRTVYTSIVVEGWLGLADIYAASNHYAPIVFLHTQELTFNRYLALPTVADGYLIAESRDGMAFRSHEFVECQEWTACSTSTVVPASSSSHLTASPPINAASFTSSASAPHSRLRLRTHPSLHCFRELTMVQRVGYVVGFTGCAMVGRADVVVVVVVGGMDLCGTGVGEWIARCKSVTVGVLEDKR